MVDKTPMAERTRPSAAMPRTDAMGGGPPGAGCGQIYWLSTVRPDGRPHVTPIAAVWLDGALHFCTGPTERKAKNLARNRYCVVTTGTNALEGLDVVIEGEAVRVTDAAEAPASRRRLHSQVRPALCVHGPRRRPARFPTSECRPPFPSRRWAHVVGACRIHPRKY